MEQLLTGALRSLIAMGLVDCEAGTTSHVFRAAFGASQPRFDRSHLPGPAILVAEQDQPRWVKNCDPVACPTIDTQVVSVPPKVTNII